jgi:hypothetical protein
VEYGESKIELGANLGQMKLGAYGTASMNLVSKEVNLDVNLTVDFMFDPAIMKMMAVKIDSFPNLEAVDLNRPLLVKNWNQTLGKARAQKYKDEMTLYGKPKEFPVELEHTINFTNLHFTWDAANKAYQSYGKIGVGNILNYQVNRMVDGFIQITRKRSGDLMDIYLKLDDNNYYYFGYSRGVMQAYSTSSNFVEALRKLSIKARQMDVKRGETPYTYMVTSDTRFGNFLRDYKRTMKTKTQGEENQINEPENQPNVVTPPATQPATEKAAEPNQEKDKVQDKEKDKEKPKDNEKKDTPVEEKSSEGEVIEVK